MVKVCENCGKEFEAHHLHKKYCSYECAEEVYKARDYDNRARQLETRTCPVCGKEFETRRSDKKYCSIECRDSAARRRYQENFVPAEKPARQKCDYCGTEYQPVTPAQKYCSKHCGHAATEERWRQRVYPSEYDNQATPEEVWYLGNRIMIEGDKGA